MLFSSRIEIKGDVTCWSTRKLKVGSDPLSGKMLLVRIVENNKIDDYCWAGKVRFG